MTEYPFTQGRQVGIALSPEHARVGKVLEHSHRNIYVLVFSCSTVYEYCTTMIPTAGA